MTERSLFWDLNGGDSQVYAQADLMDRFFRAFLNGTGDRGVLYGVGNNLLVSGTTSPIQVAMGAAVCYGMYYDTDAAVSVTIPAPSPGNSRYDRIVVRRSWALKTCRITRIAGTAAGVPVVPVLTQTAGTTWDIPLATILVNDAGVLTITDTRDWATMPIAWPANSVDTEHYEAGAVTATKIADRTRYELAGAGLLEENTAALYLYATWEGGGGIYGFDYDHWQFPDAADSSLWAYFQVDVGVVGANVALHVWSVPDTNGLGAGAENVHWDYYVYEVQEANNPLTLLDSGTLLADQQARTIDRPYRDTLDAAVAADAGYILAVRLDRAGVQLDDTYLSPIQVMGVEISWTNDC